MYGLIGPESLTDAESGALNTGSIRVTDATTTALTGTLTAGHLTLVDATAGNAVYALPAAASVPAGGVTAVKKADAGANTVTVQRVGSDVVYGTAGGGTTRAVTLPGESAVLTSNGVNAWTVMASDTPVSQLDARYNGTYAQAASPLAPFVLPHVSKKLSAMNSAAGQLKVLHFGDSYGQKLPVKLYPLLEAVAGGNAGGGQVDGSGTTLPCQLFTSATTGTVTQNTASFDAWPSGLTQTFATGATRSYKGPSGNTLVGDTLKVYYVLEPGAGTFKVQVDGADASGFTNVSAAGTLGQLGVATISTTRGGHTFTIVNLTGTVRIAYLAYYDSTTSGVVTMPVCQAGIALNSPQATAWSNFQAFLTDISPDLMTFEMKESSVYSDGSTYAQALAKLFTVTAAAAPGMDVIGIGSPPVAVSDADQVAQNVTLKAACATYGYTYWDSYAIYGSYARLTALGWNGDGTHVSTDCDEHRAMLLARDTGILAVYKRSLDGGNLVSRGLTLSRAGDTAGGTSPSTTGTSRHILRPEATLGFDLEIVPGRYTKFLKNDGATELARFDGAASGTVTSFIPDNTRIGSTSGSALKAESASMLGVRLGSNLNNPADLLARSYSGTVVTQNGVSGAVTCDLSAGSVFVLNLTGNITSLAFSNIPTNGTQYEIHFLQDATGSRTLAGVNGAIKLSGGSLTLTTTASKRDVLRFTSHAGGSWETSRSLNMS